MQLDLSKRIAGAKSEFDAAAEAVGAAAVGRERVHRAGGADAVLRVELQLFHADVRAERAGFRGC